MLRRAALLACLLSPLAAIGQDAGVARPLPNAVIGTAECSSATDTMSLTWTIAFTSGTAAIPTGAVYRILASNSTDCPISAGSFVTGTIADNISATSTTQTYPTAGATLRPGDFVSAAGKSCSGGVDSTIYVCVRLLPSGGGTAIGNATGTITLQLVAPAVPTGVSARPGDSALTVSWAAGTGSTAAASTYRVEVKAVDAAIDPVAHGGTTSNTSLRVGGLKNNVIYDVWVTAISEGGNESAASEVVQGTPVTVLDFYDQYLADGGREEGGCAGGPAGAASLLGLAALLRAFRRRP